ncbi:type II toxin-antitoxin system Phd/YefM family antitoxin [Streptomyces sp. NPDC101175]|uniref:type II toxin-antitoxin system Phd/YefM family antitoxin n=1 Tax=Streptomyces sp. NPDC101175 TaxID=3366123 RepID=UPI003832668C
METSRYSLADARNKLSDLVADVESTHKRITITKHGKDAAILIAPEDLEALLETIDLLSRDDSHSEVLRAIRQAEKDLEDGKIRTVDDLANSLKKRGRL